MPIFAAIAITSMAGSIYSSRKAAKATNRARKTEARHTAVSNRLERIKGYAQQRVASARQESSSVFLGTSAGTGLSTAKGSTQSQTYANIGFQQQLEGLNNRRVNALNKAAQYTSNAQSFSQIASLSSFAGGGTGNVGQDIGKMVQDGKFGYE